MIIRITDYKLIAKENNEYFGLYSLSGHAKYSLYCVLGGNAVFFYSLLEQLWMFFVSAWQA